MKRLIALVFLLTLVFSLTACKKDAAETQLQNALKDYSQVLAQDLPDDFSLKLYYLNPSIVTRVPLTVDRLIHFPEVNEILIDFEHLKEHTDLLRQINTDRLTPVAEPSNLHARLCYIFETDSAGELLVVAFGGENSSVFVNGVEVAFDDIFRDVIKPFVSEDVLNDLEYIYNGKIKLNDTPEGLPTETGIPEDFSFSLIYGVAGDLTYDSKTGVLVKQRVATHVEDYTTTYFFTDEQKMRIYDLLVEMEPASYPDEYNPIADGIASDPSYEIVLTVAYDGTTKTITCHDIAIGADPKDEQGERFLAVLDAIMEIIYASEEWQALPEYEFLYC
ncbi:MAG: hypothetical protein IJG45_04855 [Oscillospiraceae bacterium]|nr:hypothetical protein [Oscillospiraceae bacterium]